MQYKCSKIYSSKSFLISKNTGSTNTLQVGSILTPAFFAGAPKGAFSMSPLFDRAAEAGRLCGLRLEGLWMHVGTPEAVHAAEKAILATAV